MLESAVILVIDDEPSNLRVVVKFLEHSNFDVRVAQSGEEGIARAMRIQPDIILVDVVLPGIDGYETCRRLRQNAATQNTPVVFLTALDDLESKLRGFDAGGVDYVTKPIEQTELLARVRTHLALSRLTNKLEGIVEQRTSALQNTNKKLKLEIGRRRDMEARLAQSQKLEALGQLTGGIAHDFNNILTIIIGHSDHIKSNVNDDFPFSNELSQIGKAVQHGAALTHQLLAFARRQILQPKIVDINQCVQDIHEMFKPKIPRDVRVDIQLSKGIGAVNVDPVQLEQVMLNLFSNACDAMLEGGVLTIETRNIMLDGNEDENRLGLGSGLYVVFSVNDTGVGIASDDLERVFEPFYSTKQRGKGTGLGLPMVHGIINQSSGQIILSSILGKGTSVDVYLPQAEIIESSVAALPVRNSQTAHKKNWVVVLDDDDDVRFSIVRMLESAGHTVLSARDRAEAMACFADHQRFVGLLVADVMLGDGESGVAVANVLREEYLDFRVLFVSGFADKALDEIDLSNRDIDLLEKPFGQTDFLTRIDRLLN